MATVATPTFRIPRGVDLDNMCFYSGPPDRKNPPKSRPRRRDEPFADREWTCIDQFVDDVNETPLEPDQESKSEGVLTPTMKIAKTLGLLDSGDKIDDENTAGNSFEWGSDPLKHDNFPGDLGTERGSESSKRPATATGSNPGNPVIIEDDQPSIGSEGDRSDTDSDGDLPSPERLTDRRRNLCPEENATRADNQVVDSCISSAVRADGRGHSLPTVVDVVGAEMAQAAITHDATVPGEDCGSGKDPSVDGASMSETEHGDLPGCPDIALESGGRPPSPGLKHRHRADETGFGALADSQAHSSDYHNRSVAVETAESALGSDESYGYERKAPDRPPSKQNERKRSRSADTDISTVRTSDPTPEQPLGSSHSAKRRRSLSTIRSDSVSHRISGPKPASSPVHSGTNPQIDNADNNNVSNEDDGGGDQQRPHLHSNERPERYPASDAGRDSVDKDTDSSNEDDDDDDDSDFNENENSEDEEDEIVSRQTTTKPTALRMATDSPRIAGQAGMPKSTPRPQKTKFKFTEEEDKRLVNLKENRGLSWEEIKESFPGRSKATLQVHYYTKLKNKATVHNKFQHSMSTSPTLVVQPPLNEMDLDNIRKRLDHYAFELESDATALDICDHEVVLEGARKLLSYIEFQDKKLTMQSQEIERLSKKSGKIAEALRALEGRRPVVEAIHMLFKGPLTGGSAGVPSDDGCPSEDDLSEDDLTHTDESLSDDYKNPSSRKRGRWL